MSSKSAVSKRRISSGSPDLFRKSQEEEPVIRKEKKTFHLTPETVLLLGELQIEQQRNTGKKPNLSDLVEEGVRLLAENRRQSA